MWPLFLALFYCSHFLCIFLTHLLLYRTGTRGGIFSLGTSIVVFLFPRSLAPSPFCSSVGVFPFGQFPLFILRIKLLRWFQSYITRYPRPISFFALCLPIFVVFSLILVLDSGNIRDSKCPPLEGRSYGRILLQFLSTNTCSSQVFRQGDLVYSSEVAELGKPYFVPFDYIFQLTNFLPTLIKLA